MSSKLKIWETSKNSNWCEMCGKVSSLQFPVLVIEWMIKSFTKIQSTVEGSIFEEDEVSLSYVEFEYPEEKILWICP